MPERDASSTGRRRAELVPVVLPPLDGPVFRSVSRHDRVGGRLHPDMVARVFRKLAVRARLDPTDVSGHSCRVGTAQDLVALGLDLPAVMQAGRWKTPAMPARYAERLLPGRGAVAQLRERRRRS